MSIHYTDATVTLHHGDCLDVLRALPDASVDAVVTDPPYGLANTDPAHVAETITRWVNGERDYLPGGSGFMGKEWDAFVPPVAVWDDCLRVLKPGGHLLTFAGTRTMDLMTLGLRLAGFEVRDSIAWIHGQGFPKSLDVSKAIDARANINDETHRRIALVAEVIRKHREAKGMERAEVSEAVVGTRSGACWNWEHHQLPSAEMWPAIKAALDIPDKFDGLIDGTRAQFIGAERAVLRERTMTQGGGTSLQLRMGEAREVRADITAPATPEAERWQGWGSAMKPAFEPVVVARKPFRGTLAANVLTYGTGALNIDACRINASGQSPEPSTSQGGGRSSRGDSTTCTCPELADDRTSRTTSTPLPASSDDAPAGRSDLPASAPQGGSGGRPPLDSPADCQSSRRFGDAPAREAAEDDQASPQPRPDADTSPARCATCGRSRSIQSMPYDHSTTPHVQRDATTPSGRWPANVVLDESQAAALDEQSGEVGGSGGTFRDVTRSTLNASEDGSLAQPQTPSDYGKADGASRFFYVAKADASERVRINGTAHPTVKPLALMRWLVRLVTPPGGTVLEPFAGSGTTVEACLLEGFRCVAIEREADYLPLIVQRINRRRDPVEAVRGSGEDGGLFDLLGEDTA